MAKAATKAKPKAPANPEVEILDGFEQNSPEWLQARIGLCTASNFATIMASGKDGGDSKTRTKLLYQMAGEILCGEPAETYSNASMQRGSDMEAEAREHYARTNFAEIRRVGFVRRTLPTGRLVGCSPDALVGDDGVLEIKTMKPELLIELALRGAAGFPTQHRHQCQGALWVTGRQWCDLLIFYRGMPVAPKFRIDRSDAHIKEISDAVEIFDYELRRLVEKIGSMGK